MSNSTSGSFVPCIRAVVAQTRSLSLVRAGAIGWIATFLFACVGQPELDAQAPAQIGQMPQTSLSTGAQAKTLIDAHHLASPATEESWAATFGDGDRVVIYATAFETPQQAATQYATMRTRLTQGTPRYSAASEARVAQQPGFRFQDTAEDKQIFVFQKGRWMIGIGAIAPDMEASVYSIEWVD